MYGLGLDGTLTPYVDFLMPISALMLLDELKSAGEEGGSSRRTCTFDHVRKASAELKLPSDPDAVRYMLGIFSGLGAVSWFPDLDESLVVTKPQWLLDSMGCIIREHDGLHADLLHHLEQDPDAIPLLKQSMVKQGRFSVALLHHIWRSGKKECLALKAGPIEIKALERILQEFGLIFHVRMKGGDSDTMVESYVVPALLANPPSGTRPKEDILDRLECRNAEQCMCRLDFSHSKWLPKYLFERLVGVILTSQSVDELEAARGMVTIYTGSTLLHLMLDNWCIKAQTVKHDAFPHARRWMRQLLKEGMDKLLPKPLKRDAVYKIFVYTLNDEDVELSQLNSKKRFVRTSSNRRVQRAPLQAKWFGVLEGCQFDCCRKQVNQTCHCQHQVWHAYTLTYIHHKTHEISRITTRRTLVLSQSNCTVYRTKIV